MTLAIAARWPDLAAMLTEILIVLALIGLNGVLAMSELAIVSARPARLKPLEVKSRGAAAALRLACLLYTSRCV